MPEAPCLRSYEILPGDTLYSISLAQNIPLNTLIALNPGIDSLNLLPGERICLQRETGLPTGKIPPCASGFYWVIGTGDTLFHIAQVMGTEVQTLLELNPGIDPLNLIIGDSICLP